MSHRGALGSLSADGGPGPIHYAIAQLTGRNHGSGEPNGERRTLGPHYAMVISGSRPCVLGELRSCSLKTREIVTVDFLWFDMRLPLAILLVVIYILGMLTCSTLGGP